MLITNCTLITWEKDNRIIPNQAVFVHGQTIKEIGPSQILQEKYNQDERLDAHGQFLMPGNICAHTHFYGAFSRGLGIPGRAPADFPQNLERLWWRLDKSLTLNGVRYSALVCMIDAIRHGTTCLFDHHASPNAIDGSLEEIATCVEESGLRVSLCYEVTDRDGPERRDAGINENRRFLQYVQNDKPLDGRLGGTFGLHASLTLSEDTLANCRNAIPEGRGFHIHVAEHPIDEYDSLEKCGQRVVDRLDRHGILGPNSLIVHAVHVDAREIDILRQTQTWVTHQPRSNMNNAVGLPQTESMLRTGIKVCLGNDGFSNAMWEEWKSAYLAHKLWNQDLRRMGGQVIAQMAVYNNAELATHHFGVGPIGVIVPGAQADLILVDYHPFTPLSTENLPWHILFGFRESMVTSTMVAGKLLMRNRELLSLDEEKIVHDAKKVASSTWKNFQQLF